MGLFVGRMGVESVAGTGKVRLDRFGVGLYGILASLSVGLVVEMNVKAEGKWKQPRYVLERWPEGVGEWHDMY